MLLDFGLAEELTPVVRYHFLSFIMMIAAGNGEHAVLHCFPAYHFGVTRIFSFPEDGQYFISAFSRLLLRKLYGLSAPTSELIGGYVLVQAYHLLQFSWPHEQTCKNVNSLVEDMKSLFALECNLKDTPIDLNKVLIKVRPFLVQGFSLTSEPILLKPSFARSVATHFA